MQRDIAPSCLQSVARVGFWQRLFFVAKVMLPLWLQGLFIRSRLGSFLARLISKDSSGVKQLRKWRRIYRSNLFDIGLFRPGTVVVYDQLALNQLLLESPSPFGVPSSKRRGMSHFQVGAATIAKQTTWPERRKFIDHTLEPKDNSHSLATAFHKVIDDEVTQCVSAKSELNWVQWNELWGRISRRVIFGDAARDAVDVSELLERLMRRANWLFLPRKGRLHAKLTSRITELMITASSESLCGGLAGKQQEGLILVASQVTHWLFAMHFTLAENTARAMLVIGSQHELLSKVRSELDTADGTAASLCDSLLQACLQETMRLWPTTELISRQCPIATRLGASIFTEKTQFLVPITAWNRDQASHRNAEQFDPSRWNDKATSAVSLSFSAGSQGCPGQRLAILLGTTVLASLLQKKQTLQLAVKLNLPLPKNMRATNLRLTW